MTKIISYMEDDGVLINQKSINSLIQFLSEIYSLNEKRSKIFSTLL